MTNLQKLRRKVQTQMPLLKCDKEIKSEPEETIAERVKLNPLKRKIRNRIKNIKSKQTINWTSNIVSANKSWKKFIQIPKRNQANIISPVSP